MNISNTRLFSSAAVFAQKLKQDQADWIAKVKSTVPEPKRLKETGNFTTEPTVAKPVPPTIKTSFISKTLVGAVVIGAVVAVVYKYKRF